MVVHISMGLSANLAGSHYQEAPLLHRLHFLLLPIFEVLNNASHVFQLKYKDPKECGKCYGDRGVPYCKLISS